MNIGNCGEKLKSFPLSCEDMIDYITFPQTSCNQDNLIMIKSLLRSNMDLTLSMFT
jgi:hypothetical protein